jgi:CheY-like chemotaxis protein
MVMFLDIYSLFQIVEPEKNTEETFELDLSNKKVLYAEDTALFRSVVSSFLKDLNFGKVDLAVDGEEAWEKIQKENYDILITDIVMPRMNGMQLATNVKSNPDTKDIPIVAVTSLLNESDKKKILESGVDIYQQKLDRKGLYKAIKELLHKELVV